MNGLTGVQESCGRLYSKDACATVGKVRSVAIYNTKEMSSCFFSRMISLLFVKLCYTKIECKIKDADRIVWVNDRSFQKRFRCKLTQDNFNRIFNSKTGTNEAAASVVCEISAIDPVSELQTKIQDCTHADNISREAVQNIVDAYKNCKREGITGKIKKKTNPSLVRSFLNGRDEVIVLTTSVRRRRDISIGVGGAKKVKNSVRIGTSGSPEIVAVGITSMFDEDGKKKSNRAFLERTVKAELLAAKIFKDCARVIVAESSYQTKSETEDKWYFVMKKCNGGDLFSKLEGNNTLLTPAQRLQIAKDIVDAVKMVHEKELLHRDLKPENILLTIDSSGNIRANLADWGLSCETKETEVLKNGFFGTVHYYAPEMRIKAVCQQSKQTDCWALGRVLLELQLGIFDQRLPSSVEERLEDNAYKKVVKGLLAAPGERMTAAEASTLLSKIKL